MNRLLATASQSAATTLRRQHTLAIARQIPSSFVDALSHHADSDTTTTNTVSLATSIHQHDVYLQELRKHIPTLCLPAIESHPDCLFVEDTVVAIDNVAVITHIGAASRVGEVDSVKEVLGQLGMEVVDMRSNSIINSEMNKGMSGGRSDSVAHCDGGDVLYTGRHLFVGMSNRTNELGYELLREVFGSTVEVVKVPPVIQGRDVLHLKSAVTHIDDNTLLAPTGPLGDQLLDRTFTSRGYNATRLPDILSCNAVTVNGHVLAQDKCDVSKQIIKEACDERGLGLTFVDTAELAKKDAALTCCSVLLNL